MPPYIASLYPHGMDPAVPPINKDPSIPLLGNPAFARLPNGVREMIYRKCFPVTTGTDLSVDVSSRADLPGVCQILNFDTWLGANKFFFENNNFTASRGRIPAAGMRDVIRQLKIADGTALRWIKEWEVSFEVIMPPNAPCQCAQSIACSTTFSEERMELTGDASPGQEGFACPDHQQPCDYRNLFRKVRVAYGVLGETMERLYPGVTIKQLECFPDDEEQDDEGDPVDDWEVDWDMPNEYPDSEDSEEGDEDGQ